VGLTDIAGSSNPTAALDRLEIKATAQEP
jgi:hypothetical protein